MKVNTLSVEVAFESVPDGSGPSCSCAQLTAQMDHCTNECDSESTAGLQPRSQQSTIVQLINSDGSIDSKSVTQGVVT